MLQVLEATIGGTKRHLLDLCTGLDPAEFDVQVACPRVRSEAHGDISFVDDLRRAGVPVHLVPMVRAISPARDAAAVVRLARLIRGGSFDVIHAHSSKAGFLGRQAALFDPRARVVYSPHGFYFQNFRSGPRRWAFKLLERVSGPRTHALVALSRGEFRAAVAEGVAAAHKIRLVENGIEHVQGLPRSEARSRLQIGQDALVVGTVSRFTAQKAPMDLIAAARCLVRERPGLLFVWFGDGELRPLIEREIDRSGLGQNFKLLGYVPEARSLLPALDVFLLASRWEGLPYTIMEAMDAGVPVVATDVVGSQDVIDDGRNGFLVPPAGPERLAARVAELLQNPGLAGKISAAAAGDVLNRFNRRAMVQKMASLYRELVWGEPVG